jgi:HlyD family secretion protein
MTPRHLTYLSIAAAVLVIAGAAFWMLFMRSVEVEVARAERDVAIQVFGLGTVEARVSSKVGFKVAGILVDIRADVGDRVSRGTVLARLDDREQNARVGRARAAIDQAEANLQKATASVEKAQANYANAKSINERRQSLLASNNTSIESAQTAKAVHDASFADVNLAQSDLALARAAISDAKAQKQLESTTLDFHTLAAPYDAMVIARLKELGSALAAGEPVFTLIDPASVWVLAYIDESRAGGIQVGNLAEIVLRSLPGRRLTGRVARIEPEGDRVNEERRVQIAFDQLPADFHLGEQAEVYITTVRLESAVLVPEGAVSGRNPGRGTVWLLNGGQVQQRSVTLGHRTLDGRLEIVGGIPEGAFAISKPNSSLRDGRAGRIAEGRNQ